MKDYPVIYQGNLFRMKTDLDYILFVRWRTEYPKEGTMRKHNRQKKIDKRLSMNRHHLTPKSRGGKGQDWNIAIFDIERHIFWHKVFGNRTLEEVIELLIRFKRFKDNQKRRE